MNHDRIRRVVDDAPSALAIVVARGGSEFGIAVLHGGEAVAFLTPQQARADAEQLLIMAGVCERPGQPPELAR